MQDSIFTAILVATIVAGTPLIIAALGELVTEKSGVLNLGAEGMMAVGAIAGLAAGALMALIFAVLTLTLLANQVASGLALSIFGVGLSAFIGKPYESASLPAVPALRIPILADIPVLGPMLFNQQALVYVSWLLFAAVAWFLYRSRAGLTLRAVGESPSAAHAIGYPVIRIRYLATLFG